MRARTVLLAAVCGAILCGPAAAGPFVITGHGSGHGMGMGEYGAQGYALHGWSYRRILRHYYPGTTLGRTPARTVRVLLLQGKSRVNIGSRRSYRLRDADGRAWTLRGRLVLTRQPTLRQGDDDVNLALPLTVEPGAKPLRVDGSAYRGSLTLLRLGPGLAVVNTVRLELYVRAVLGWVMSHTWKRAALRAQAVAARSYAVASPPRRHEFDLFDDRRDQAYGGIQAEFNTTTRAVAATGGEVLMWHGQVALTPYSSTTGGRTQSLADAVPGANPLPYLASVSDPYDSLSPLHTWGPYRFTRARLGRRLHLPPPTALGVYRNRSRRVATVVVRWRGGRRRVSGLDFKRALHLPSTWFSVKRS